VTGEEGADQLTIGDVRPFELEHDWMAGNEVPDQGPRFVEFPLCNIPGAFRAETYEFYTRPALTASVLPPSQVSVDRSVSAKFVDQIAAFAGLTKGWNGYSAATPTDTAIQNAKELVAAAGADGIIPERVEPSAIGGIGVTFTFGSREVVAEFYNNGTAHALFADDATEEMDTRPVASNGEGYQAFLADVRQYLYGQQSAVPARRSDVSRR
jgi:hypothetical protein